MSAEMLRGLPDVTIWSLGHRPQLAPLTQRIGLPGAWVERKLDPTIRDHNSSGALNGHIPISAIFGAVGMVIAALRNSRDIVVSNESSASDPNFIYKGIPINHQYSKSLEFEKDFQNYISHRVGDSIRYYSLLRPFSELQIASMFADHFDKYHDVFSSCNRAFIQTSDSMSWCGQCPKCAFTFLVLTPFISRDKLELIWGKNLLLDPHLETTYQQLLGIVGDKPLECVGEVKESRAAMSLSQKQYPELNK